jgi:hypothetical protein
MAVAVRGGARVVGRAAALLTAGAAPVPFTDQEVEEGDALIHQHFVPQVHPDARTVSFLARSQKPLCVILTSTYPIFSRTNVYAN